MAALGFVWFPYNGNTAGVLIYAAAFAPFITESIALCVVIIAGLVLATAAEGLLLHANPWAWGGTSLIAVMVGAGNLLMAQRMRAGMKLNMAQQEIAHLAKVAERERIARDLHDVLGHTLSVVVLKSELAGKIMQHDPERARKEISEVENIARSALAEVREAIRGYRSEGLPAEIDRARATLDAAGVTLECDSTPPRMLPAEETVISLVLREAVTNIVRHAHAGHCRIRFNETGTGRQLVIEDDGRGGIRHEGNGLRGMRERLESLGGKLRIESTGSTRLTIEIPARQESA
jgi:two-component system sensor histidine kinase DesK